MKFKSVYGLLALLIACYVAVFSYVSFARLDTHKSYLADIGVYDQVVWNTLHGHFMHQSYSFTGESYVRFFYHFDPILLLFVPLYLIIASPKWFLLLQTLAIGLSVIPIFLLARKNLGEWVALLLSLCYFLYYPLQNGNLYDFHEIGLAVPVVAWLLWAMVEHRQRWFWALALLLLLIQEDMSLVLFAAGCYLVLYKRYRQGLLTMTLSAVFFVVVMKFVIPAFSPGGEHIMFKGTGGYLPRYAWLGSSPEGVIKTLITRPMYVLGNIATPDIFRYLFGLLLPVALLPLGSVLALVAGPVILINILSQNQMMYNFYFYHSLIVSPVFFTAAVMVLARIKMTRQNLYHPLLLAIFVLSLLFSVCCGLLPFSFNRFHYNWQDLKPRPEYKEIKQIQQLIPPESSVCTQENLGVFFSQRQYIYGFPVKCDSVDYVVLCFNNPFYGEAKRDFLFRSYMQRPEAERRAIVQDLLEHRGYQKIYDHNGYLVLKKSISMNKVP